MAHDYLNDVKRVAVLNATAAGTTDVNCTGVDCDGFDSIVFTAKFGALTATQVTTLKAQQSDDNGSSDGWSDIAGSQTAALADGDSNDIALLEVSKPTKRYVRCVVERGTENAVIESVTAALYSAAEKPVTQDATVVVTNRVVSAAEGTA